MKLLKISWLSSAFLLVIITLGVRLLGFGKDAVVAAVIGIGFDLDTFFMAMLIPGALAGMVRGAIQSVVVPLCVRTFDSDAGRTPDQIAATSLFFTAVGSFIGAIFLSLTSYWWMAVFTANFPAEKSLLASELMIALAWFFALQALSANYASLLNARKRYVFPTAMTGVPAVVSLIAVILFGSDYGVWALTFGLLVGSLAELVANIVAASRQRIPVVPRFFGLSPTMRRMFGQMAYVLLGSLFLSLVPFVDSILAASLGEGSVASLHYGMRLVNALTAVIGLSIGQVLLPELALLVKMKDAYAIRRLLQLYVFRIGVLGFLVSALLSVFSVPLIALLFERGAFGASETLRVSAVQTVYAFQLVVFTLTVFFTRLISACIRSDLLLIGSVFSASLNLVLDLIMMEHFGMVGLAAATVLANFATLILVWYMATKLLRAFES